MIQERYDIPTAAAWILGHARQTAVPELPESLRWKTTAESSEDELIQNVTAGREAGLKLYPFKSGTQTLTRTRRTLGFLHSLSFETMLDVGSGRGVFLIPFIKEFVVVTVPSKPDNNPEHIHLLTKDKLTQIFSAAGCTRLNFDGVEGHLFMVASTDK